MLPSSFQRNSPSLGHTKECLAALSSALKDKKYAVIGGAALVALGSTHRTTEDVDILVPTGTTIVTKNTLSMYPQFTIDPRTRHLTYSSPNFQHENPIQIDVLTEAMAFIPAAELESTFRTDSGVNIAKPSTLLNYKISTSYGRSSLWKKRTDWEDVQYLIAWHVNHVNKLPPGGIPNASAEAYEDLHYFAEDVTPEEWLHIGGKISYQVDDATATAVSDEYLVYFSFQSHQLIQRINLILTITKASKRIPTQCVTSKLKRSFSTSALVQVGID
jgi:hypothetical protein